VRSTIGAPGSLTLASLSEPRYSQSLERGLAILACFSPRRPSLGVADVAQALGLGRSTTHRYMTTLLMLGYLEQESSRKYRLGLRVIDLGMSALSSMGLREHSYAPLRQLRDSSGYTVSLAILDGPEILYVDRARSHRRGAHLIDLDLRVGSKLPAHCTALGKLLLAFLSQQEQRTALAAAKLTRRTAHTITTKTALRSELQRIGEDGLAVNNQELVAGLHAIAVPVHSEEGEVIAALNMAAHVSSISPEELADRLTPHLITTADSISARLGYRRPDQRD
jgi:IclR family transcriptional regulator, pca regulon regulatory protein